MNTAIFSLLKNFEQQRELLTTKKMHENRLEGENEFLPSTEGISLFEIQKLGQQRSSTILPESVEHLLRDNLQLDKHTKKVNFVNFEPQLPNAACTPERIQHLSTQTEQLSLCYLPLDWWSAMAAENQRTAAKKEDEDDEEEKEGEGPLVSYFLALQPAKTIRFSFFGSEVGLFETAKSGFLGYSAQTENLDFFQLQYLLELSRDLRLIFFPAINSVASLKVFLETDGKHLLLGCPMATNPEQFPRFLKAAIALLPSACECMIYCENNSAVNQAKAAIGKSKRAIALVTPTQF